MYNSDDTQAYWNQIQSYLKIQRANERYIKRLAWLLIFGLILCSNYLLDKRPEIVSIDKAFLALGVVWLGFLPCIQYLFDRHRSLMPFFPLVGIYYATSFGLPIFSSKSELSGRFSISNVSNEALTLTLLGLAAMNIAFFISKYTIWNKIKPIRLPQTYSLDKLLIFLWVLILLNTAARYIPSIRSIPSIGMFIGGGLYLAYGMFYILWSRGKLPKTQVWLLLLIFLPIDIIPRLSSGLLAEIMILFLFMFNIVWFVHRKIPVILISILIVLYLAFSPVKAEYRNLTWNSRKPEAQLNPIERLQLFINLSIEYHQKYTFNKESIYRAPKISATDKAAERSAMIIFLSDVMKNTPEIVPYWNGETYLPLLTSYIPRIIWPDKPEIRIGNDFGHRYKILDADDFSTSMNLPMIVEMYVNFGSWGVIIGMSLLGSLLVFIDKKLNHPNMSELEFAVGASTMFQLVYQETNASLLFGPLIPFLLVIHILFKFFISPIPNMQKK
ncbi:MAG: O-antigen polysaccharide polymerase Wzy [Heteroscytonema crispum UTEX LB 1556]